MARPHTASASKHRPTTTMASSSSVLLLHAAWIAAVVAVYLSLCTIHSRKPSSTRRRAASRSSASSSNRRGSSMESISGDTPAARATLPAKVSSTPAGDDTAVEETDSRRCSPVTVIEVGTHGPIAPAFVLPPAPDPVPPRRSLSLSSKHIRFAAERLGRIRSMQRGGEGGAAAGEDDVFVGCRRGGEVGEEGTLWTKTIIHGDRCGVPDDGDEGDLDGGGGKRGTVPWKSYRPRQQRSLLVTRSNSFAGVGSAGARRLADPRF